MKLRESRLVADSGGTVAAAVLRDREPFAAWKVEGLTQTRWF